MKSKGHRLVQEGVKCEEGPVGLTRGAENMYVHLNYSRHEQKDLHN